MVECYQNRPGYVPDHFANMAYVCLCAKVTATIGSKTAISFSDLDKTWYAMGDGPGENIVKCGFGDGGLSELQFCEQHPLFEWIVFEWCPF